MGQVEELEPIEEAEEELMDEAEEEVEVEVEAMAEEATAATVPASNICENRSAQWLYNHCNQLCRYYYPVNYHITMHHMSEYPLTI